MFELRLDAKQCICCGICMDVCAPQALRMRTWRGRTVEGWRLAPILDREDPVEPAAAMSFPYLADPERCDGCLKCVDECPVAALSLKQLSHRRRRAA